MEAGPIGKPPLPQARRQCIVQPQQYPVRAQKYSQDVRVQMGEPVRTELHQPQQMMFDPHEYQPTIKVNNHFIAENSRNYQKEAQQLIENYVMIGPQVTSKNSINRNITEMHPAHTQQRSSTSTGVQISSKNSINPSSAGTNEIQREVADYGRSIQ